MPGYVSFEKQHKVGIKLMCPFVEKLFYLKKVCGSGPKSAQKNCPEMPYLKANLINALALLVYV